MVKHLFRLPGLFWLGGVSLLIVATQLGAGADRSSDPLREAQKQFASGAKAEAFQAVTAIINAEPRNSRALFLRGLFYEAERQFPKAISDYDQALKLPQVDPALFHQRGIARFKAGQFEKAVDDFTEYIHRVPKQEPYHWQRGLAFYYAGRFHDAARQFQLHQTVNSNDVENAVWHYLSVAAAEGREKARAALLPIGHDARVPMNEIYALFSGKGQVDPVQQAIKGASPGEQPGAAFYGDLYLGLYYLAERDPRANQHLARAAKSSQEFGFMGDVARLQADLLEKQSSKGK